MQDGKDAHGAVTGGIGNTGYVDLTGLTKPEEIRNITRICNTGAVLVPEALAGELAKIPMENVGQVVKVPTGKRVVVRAGMEELSAKTLENGAGDDDQLMLLVGQTVLRGVPARVAYELVVTGQLIAPHEAQDVISSAITHLAGQVLFYRGQDIKIFMEDAELDAEFFELLREPVALLIMGDLTFAADVTKELLLSKVSDILLLGELRVPKHLVAAVHVLTSKCLGSVIGYDKDSVDGEGRAGKDGIA